MSAFAVTLSDLIEKGGAYAGLAAFFGLAVLSVLYFAQARELKRLRDWAGRAPERAQELEHRVVQQAEARRGRAPKPPPKPAVVKPIPATPAGALKPAATPAAKAAAAAAAPVATASVTPASEKDADAETPE